MPVAPTTAAMAPKAPTGASHMIMERIRKTSFCRWPMPFSTGSPLLPMACRAKPTNRATNRVCSTTSVVSAENSVVGMMCSRNSAVVSFSAVTAPAPFSATSAVIRRPSPGWMTLPTSRPTVSARVDMVRK